MNFCKILMLTLALSTMHTLSLAETFTINGTAQQADLLIQRTLGPGTMYQRWRLPNYPLNVNVITVDLTNPYNKLETMQANETIGSTELFAHAAARLSTPTHQAMGGANGSFWCVSGQPPHSSLLIGTTYGGNVRNGKIITETNAYSDQWCGGPANTCVIANDTYGNMHIEPMLWRGYVSAAAFGKTEFHQVNKVVRQNEIGLYNDFYPAAKAFQPVEVQGTNFVITSGDAVEVYLERNPQSQWMVATPTLFTVAKINTDAGGGSRGAYEAVLVARGAYADMLKKLQVGDELQLEHQWTSYATGYTPNVENLMQGLSLCMKDGEKIPEGNNNSYNNTIYPRTGYGSSADKHTLYMITIDKSNDAQWGMSAGCNTDVMCDIAKELGCMNLSSVDAGGSTQMLVGNKVVNTTTESTPRAIANGFMVFTNVPVDDPEVTSLAFDAITLRLPPYATVTPQILGYNRYGALVDEFFLDADLTCQGGTGTCQGNTFRAGKGGESGTLTARYGNATATINFEVIESQVQLRLDPIFIDASREYLVEVNALLDGKEFPYDPTELQWTIDDSAIATIDHHGILRGMRNGSTTITASIGEFEHTVPVHVQIAPGPVANHNDWENWTAKASTGLSNTQWNGGTFSFTYGSPRDPYVNFTRQLTVHSLPDALSVGFTSSIPVKKITVDIRNRDDARASSYVLTPSEGDSWLPGVEHTVEMPLPGLASDLFTYPVSIRGIKPTFTVSSDHKGEQSFTLTHVSAHYNNFSQGVEDINRDTIPLGTVDRMFNLQGIEVPAGNLAPGIYLRIVGNQTQKIIIR